MKILKVIQFTFLSSIIIILLPACSGKKDLQGKVYVTYGAGDVKPIAGKNIFLVNEQIDEKIKSLKMDASKKMRVIDVSGFNKKYERLKKIVDEYSSLDKTRKTLIENKKTEILNSFIQIKKGALYFELWTTSYDYEPNVTLVEPDYIKSINKLFVVGVGDWSINKGGYLPISGVDLSLFHEDNLIGTINLSNIVDGERKPWEEGEKINKKTGSYYNSWIQDRIYIKDKYFSFTKKMIKDIKEGNNANFSLVPTDITISVWDSTEEEYDVNFSSVSGLWQLLGIDEKDKYLNEIDTIFNDFPYRDNIWKIESEFREMSRIKDFYWEVVRDSIQLSTDSQIRLIIDTQCPSTRTTYNGDFEFDDVKKGSYHLYIYFNTSFTSLYWYSKISTPSKKPIELTNHNSSDDLYFNWADLVGSF